MNANRYKIKAEYELFSPHSAICNPQSNWGVISCYGSWTAQKGSYLKFKVQK